MRTLLGCLLGMFSFYTLPAGYLHAGQPVAEMDDGLGRWVLQTGYAERRGGEISAIWRPGLVSQRIAQMQLNQRAPRPELGPLNSYADRTYENGYVFRDEGTEDPLSIAPGLTWYWGYDEAEQYDGRSVSFQSASYTDTRIEPVQLEEQYAEQGFDQQGVDIALQASLWQNEIIDVGVAVGLSFYGNKSFGMQVEQRWDRQTQVTRQTVDTYDTPFLPFPDPGHAGTLEGPGYLLNNIPDDRQEVEIGRSVREGRVTSAFDLEFESMDFRLGPTFSLTPHARVDLMITPNIRMAHVRAVAESRTLVEPAGRRPVGYEDRQTKEEWILGYGIAGELHVRVYGPWQIVAGAGIDRWEDNLVLTADPFETIIELGEWNFTLGVGRAW